MCKTLCWVWICKTLCWVKICKILFWVRICKTSRWVRICKTLCWVIICRRAGAESEKMKNLSVLCIAGGQTALCASCILRMIKYAECSVKYSIAECKTSQIYITTGVAVTWMQTFTFAFALWRSKQKIFLPSSVIDFEKSTVQANLVERQSSETVLRSVQGRKQEALKLFAVSKRILFALLFGILLWLLAGKTNQQWWFFKWKYFRGWFPA